MLFRLKDRRDQGKGHYKQIAFWVGESSDVLTEHN